jgi:hypothetical protein
MSRGQQGCSALLSFPGGKLAEGWDANTGLMASCPNIQPKNNGPKVRHDFHFLVYFLIIGYFSSKRCTANFGFLP